MINGAQKENIEINLQEEYYKGNMAKPTSAQVSFNILYTTR